MAKEEITRVMFWTLIIGALTCGALNTITSNAQNKYITTIDGHDY